MTEYSYNYKRKSLKVISPIEVKEYTGSEAIEIFKKVIDL